MNVAIYARVSTRDKDQNPETSKRWQPPEGLAPEEIGAIIHGGE